MPRYNCKRQRGEDLSLYVRRLQCHAHGYLDTRSHVWNRPGNSGLHDSRLVLVEVWSYRGEAHSHASRNPFRPVGQNSGLRQALHALATGMSMDVFEEAHRAKAKRPGHEPEHVLTHPKSLSTPDWATEDKVLGYTGSVPLQSFGSGSLPLQADLAELPTVYYWNGHATMDHEARGNIGWEWGTAYTCEFFGNVDEQWAFAWAPPPQPPR